MSLYHCSVSLSHNACASSAYISGVEMYSDRDGKIYQYGKEEVIASAVMLPAHAPAELQDREVLWNKAEASERQYDGQVCRRFQISLPNELTPEEAKECVADFCSKLTEQGMCVEYGIHYNVGTGPQGEDNLHAHILATTRPVSNDGDFEVKRTSVFVVRDEAGHELRCQSAEIPEGYSKIPVLKDGCDDPGRFIYRVTNDDGTKSRVLFDSKSDAPEGSVFVGYENQRTRSGDRMVWQKEYISVTSWDTKEQLYEWRREWADSYNDAIDRYADRIERDEGYVPDHVDHRSYIDQADSIERIEALIEATGVTPDDPETVKLLEISDHIKERQPLPSTHISEAHNPELYTRSADLIESHRELQAEFKDIAHEVRILDRIERIIDRIENAVDAVIDSITAKIEDFLECVDAWLTGEADPMTGEDVSLDFLDDMAQDLSVDLPDMDEDPITTPDEDDMDYIDWDEDETDYVDYSDDDYYNDVDGGDGDDW